MFDIETTGFSRFNDHIIEIGAVRYEQGQRVQVFSKFVKPPCSIPAKITELTGIEDDMVRDADPIDIVLPEFLNFAQGSIFVAHNADFDIGFITENARRCDLEFEPVVLDTLGLARALHPEFKNHKLNTLTKECNVTLLNHHRACDDAQATGEIFLKLMKEWQALDLPLESINQTPSGFALARHTSEDLLLYIRNQQGVKTLYELLSRAHTEYFFK